MDRRFFHRLGASQLARNICSAAGEAGCPFAPRCPLVEASCRATPPPLLAFEAERRVACPVTLEAAHHG